MDLLQKFAVVEVKTDQRITEMDRDYCEQHQKAYETALISFKELEFFWGDMNAAQEKLLGDKNGPFYHDYLVSHEGPSISKQSINRHIEALHNDYPSRILADKIYRNRENLSFCKQHGIRLSGPALGRPKKDEPRDKAQDYRDACE